jgi:hypothetical protein
MGPGIALEIRNFCRLGLPKNVERKKPVFACVTTLIAVCSLCVAPASAQQLATEPQVIASQAGVPSLIRFTGTAQDVNGNPLAGLVGITFSIYSEESGGSPLWVETQNVQADKNGHYAANQFLEYSGTVWACTTVGTDMGGITDVVAGTDLTGGGTSGKVTLNVDTTKVPQLAAANTFTANQTVSGSVTAMLSANGVALSGASPNVGVYGASSGASTTGMGRGQAGVWGDTGGASGDGFYGVVGTADKNSAGLFLNNGTFTTLLVQNSGSGDAMQASTAGNVGIYSQAAGPSIEGSNLGSTAIWGDTGAAAGAGFSAVLGTADDNVAGYFVNNALDVPALAATNDSTNRLSIVFQTFANFGECIIDVSGNLNCSGGGVGSGLHEWWHAKSCAVCHAIPGKLVRGCRFRTTRQRLRTRRARPDFRANSKRRGWLPRVSDSEGRF